MSCRITAVNGELMPGEAEAYIERGRALYGREPSEIIATIDGDEVSLEYIYPKIPFQRIRRITGYLVGDLSRFNNGKRAEESERVKHGGI